MAFFEIIRRGVECPAYKFAAGYVRGEGPEQPWTTPRQPRR